MANPVGGQSIVIAPTITVTASSAYSAGDVVGGEIELTRVFASAGSRAILQSVMVTDVAEQDEAFQILFFDADPSQTYTDHEAVPTLAGDIPNLVSRLAIPAADYVSVGGLAICHVDNIGRIIKAAKGATSLWAVLVATGTPTYGNTDDLRIKLGFIQE